MSAWSILRGRLRFWGRASKRWCPARSRSIPAVAGDSREARHVRSGGISLARSALIGAGGARRAPDARRYRETYTTPAGQCVARRARGRLQRLQELEHWIKESAGADNRERVRGDAVAVAIDHVQQAMDALELASRD